MDIHEHNIMTGADTIAAIATGMGNAGIGIVRISGPDAVGVASKAWSGKPEKYASHSCHFGHVLAPDGSVIDEAILLFMKGPKSYTGEDVVEIQCHGGSFVIREVLEAVLSAGARAAEPGEFTKRAFLNGRLDLSRAEAVMDLISAENEYARQSSYNQLRGSLYEKVREMGQVILHHTAFIETALDDPEHIDVTGYGGVLKEAILPLTDRIELLIRRSAQGRMIREGIRTVILGRPNAGKSSLLNALLGEERAIVTEIPGTTRDTLEETLVLGNITLRIVDTAGLRSGGDTVEQIGIRRARESAKDADLILYMIDGSRPFEEPDAETAALIREKASIILINKADLPVQVQKEDVEKAWGVPVFLISAKEEQGLSELEEQIEKMFLKEELNYNDQVIITHLRHKEALVRAKESLNKVLESIDAGLPEDFYSIDLTAAYEALGTITGETSSEDLINEIFSKFCVGK